MNRFAYITNDGDVYEVDGEVFAVFCWQSHCLQCPLIDHALDGAAPEDQAPEWLERVACPCRSIGAFRCAGCHQYLRLYNFGPAGLCEHFGLVPSPDSIPPDAPRYSPARPT